MINFHVTTDISLPNVHDTTDISVPNVHDTTDISVPNMKDFFVKKCDKFIPFCNFLGFIANKQTEINYSHFLYFLALPIIVYVFLIFMQIYGDF